MCLHRRDGGNMVHTGSTIVEIYMCLHHMIAKLLILYELDKHLVEKFSPYMAFVP